jgi:hypothetical protein
VPSGPTVVLPGESLLTAKSVTAWARTQLAATAATAVAAAAADSSDSTTTELPLPQGFVQLLQLLRCADGDVRDAALKALKKAVAPTPPTTVSNSNSSSFSSLQLPVAALCAAREAAASALAVEQHTPNVRRLLRLLCRLAVRIGPQNSPQNGLQEQEGSAPSSYGSAAFVAALEQRVAGDAGSSTGAGAVSGAALELLGHCLAPRQASSEQVSTKPLQLVLLL